MHLQQLTALQYMRVMGFRPKFQDTVFTLLCRISHQLNIVLYKILFFTTTTAEHGFYMPMFGFASFRCDHLHSTLWTLEVPYIYRSSLSHPSSLSFFCDNLFLSGSRSCFVHTLIRFVHSIQ